MLIYKIHVESRNKYVRDKRKMVFALHSPVIGSKMKKEECAAYEESKRCHGDVSKCKRTPETGFLFTVNRKRMEAGQRRQILTNALVQAFLYFKWHKVKWFCFMAIGFHVSFTDWLPIRQPRKNSETLYNISGHLVVPLHIDRDQRICPQLSIRCSRFHRGNKYTSNNKHPDPLYFLHPTPILRPNPPPHEFSRYAQGIFPTASASFSVRSI